MTDFKAEAELIIKCYPKLHLKEQPGPIILAGEVDLITPEDEILDTYQLEIHQSDEYPFSFPWVYETGGKIPINIDWHIYEDTGRCCIKVPPEEEVICKKGLSLADFIKLELLPYLFNQTFRRDNGYFINERGHGVLGLLEYYGEKLGTTNVAEIIRLLYYIYKNPEPNRVAECFCGKKQKYRRCHRDAYQLLSLIKKENLLLHMKLLTDFYKKVE